MPQGRGTKFSLILEIFPNGNRAENSVIKDAAAKRAGRSTGWRLAHHQSPHLAGGLLPETLDLQAERRRVGLEAPRPYVAGASGRDFQGFQ